MSRDRLFDPDLEDEPETRGPSHPESEEDLAPEFGQSLSGNLRGVFSPMPGHPGPVPAGTVAVCPIDPGHRQRRIQQRGQKLRCPEHDVELIPK